MFSIAKGDTQYPCSRVHYSARNELSETIVLGVHKCHFYVFFRTCNFRSIFLCYLFCTRKSITNTHTKPSEQRTTTFKWRTFRLMAFASFAAIFQIKFNYQALSDISNEIFIVNTNFITHFVLVIGSSFHCHCACRTIFAGS